MAVRRFEPHPVPQAYAASGNINMELSPKPYTITRMAIVFRGDITTTSATWYNDPWDRIIQTLNLTGRGKTFFSFTNMRAPYHMSRFISPLLGATVKRPTVIADSQTNALQQFGYVFHFGVAPFRINPMTGMLEDNPFDLSGGIPPSEKGNLSLGGTFAAAAAMGANTAVNGTAFDVYLWGVQPEAGDAPEAYLPKAFPVWSMRSPTPTATSALFGTQDNVPGGDFLHSMLVMCTNGTNAPRDDGVLGSLMVYNQLEAREIWKAEKYKAAEILSQMAYNGWPPTDNGATPGVPAITHVADEGLVWLPLYQQASKGHPLYGVDLRGVASGDLQLRYGVEDATGVTMDVLYRKYQLNMDHPANAAA